MKTFIWVTAFLCSGIQSYALPIKIKFGLIVDKSQEISFFNTLASQGLKEAKNQLEKSEKKINIQIVQAKNTTDHIQALNRLAHEKYDLIFSFNAEAVHAAALKFQKQKFILIDTCIKQPLPNIISITFQEDQVAYLAGALAALISKNKIGFIGSSLDANKNLEKSFFEGAQTVEPKIELLRDIIDIKNRSAQARKMALLQYERGVNIIFTTSLSYQGVFEAAQETKKLAIGGAQVDNSNVTLGHVLTNILKKIDYAVLQTCKKFCNEIPLLSIENYNLYNQGIDLPLPQHSAALLSNQVVAKIQSLKQKLIQESTMHIGLILDKGGKDDQSFNALAQKGLEAFQKTFDSHRPIETHLVEPTENASFESYLRSFAKKKFHLIIAIGVVQKTAIEKIAQQFTQQNFVLIDAASASGLPNLHSITFSDHEGSFLVGALAGKKADKLGFIGGIDIPLMRRFECGFRAGALHTNPNAKVISNFIGTTGEAWNDPINAYKLAIHQFNNGVEIIYTAASASNMGVFNAAEEKKKLAIGVDSNQNGIKPGYILTSMLKKVDKAVFSSCQQALENKFESGISDFGLANQGVDYALDQNNQSLILKQDTELLESLKKKIISGTLKVPDYYRQITPTK